MLLVQRDLLRQVRLPQSSYIKLLTTIFISVVCILIYYDVQGDVKGVQNRRGALFFLCLNLGFSGINNVTLIFPMERPVFLREASNGTYRVASYFWAKIFAELPANVLIPVLQSSLVYFAIGFNLTVWTKYATFCGIAILIYSAFGGFGYVLGTAIRSPQVASAMVPLLVVPQFLFCGFFVDQSNIPGFLLPIKEISIFKYGYQAFMFNEFTDLDIECMRETDMRKYCDPLGDFTSPQELLGSCLALLIIWVVFYFIALVNFVRLSNQYE